MRAQPEIRTDQIFIEPWPDPLIDTLGHDARSPYVETYWLGIIGPCTAWLLRYIVTELERQPDGFYLDVNETAIRLGVGMKGGRNAPLVRSLCRLVQFQMATMRDSGTMAVRRRVPPLAHRHLIRLPRALQEEHTSFLETRAHAS